MRGMTEGSVGKHDAQPEFGVESSVLPRVRQEQEKRFLIRFGLSMQRTGRELAQPEYFIGRLRSLSRAQAFVAVGIRMATFQPPYRTKPLAMKECKRKKAILKRLRRREVAADFERERVTSDGDWQVLREVDRRKYVERCDSEPTRPSLGRPRATRVVDTVDLCD